MTGHIEKRLAELGIELPKAPVPAANYIPFTKVGDIVHISGQIPKIGDDMIVGKLGAGFSVEDGQNAARVCAINLIAQMKAAANGDLDRVRVLKLNGFVNATQDFELHPAVINGASDLMVEVFGDKGRHARSAVGMSSLPFQVAVEIEGIVVVE